MRNNDEPAFPVNTSNSDNAGSCFPSAGMTLRDYFAGQVLAPMVGAAKGVVFGEDCDATNLRYAKAAYALADAMLMAREPS